MNESSLPLVLFIVFLVLKLTDNIDWSWWWVTSPLWIGIALLIAIVIISLTIKWLYDGFNMGFRKKR